MKQKALRAGDVHSHEDEECRKRSTLRFGRCLTSATGAQQRARRENVPRHILSYIGNYIFYVEKLPEECIGDEGNEKRKEMEKN